MWFLYLLLLLIPLAVLYYFWYEHNNVVQFKQRNIKYAPLPNLFWTIIRGENFTLQIDEHLRKHNLDTLGLNMLFQYSILISNPDLIQTVLVKQFTNFTNRRVRLHL